MAFTLKKGQKAPDFSLLSTDGTIYSLADFDQSAALVIFFTCNHCPYVINSDEMTKKIVNKYKEKNISFVAINSNSPNTYVEDSYDHMVDRMKKHRFPWNYLHDSDQKTALAYGALKTPHFFLFDKSRHLIYTGRAVDSPRFPEKIKEHDLEKALDEHLSGKNISNPVTNPIGCNIKWDNKPKHWMPPEACDLI